MRWDSEHGVWSLLETKWFGIRGTTFRNAGFLTVEFVFADDEYSIAFYTGTHTGMTYWLRESCAIYEWKPKKCKCYDCLIHRPMPPETAKALSDAMKEMMKEPGRKLPPRDS